METFVDDSEGIFEALDVGCVDLGLRFEGGSEFENEFVEVLLQDGLRFAQCLLGERVREVALTMVNLKAHESNSEDSPHTAMEDHLAQSGYSLPFLVPNISGTDSSTVAACLVACHRSRTRPPW